MSFMLPTQHSRAVQVQRSASCGTFARPRNGPADTEIEMADQGSASRAPAMLHEPLVAKGASCDGDQQPGGTTMVPVIGVFRP
jgi:hypothetical protein